jgi:hypothetical protein
MRQMKYFRARNRRENSNAKSESDSDASDKENKKERGREKKKRSASTSSGSGSSSRRFVRPYFLFLVHNGEVSEYTLPIPKQCKITLPSGSAGLCRHFWLNSSICRLFCSKHWVVTSVCMKYGLSHAWTFAASTDWSISLCWLQSHCVYRGRTKLSKLQNRRRENSYLDLGGVGYVDTNFIDLVQWWVFV